MHWVPLCLQAEAIKRHYTQQLEDAAGALAAQEKVVQDMQVGCKPELSPWSWLHEEHAHPCIAASMTPPCAVYMCISVRCKTVRCWRLLARHSGMVSSWAALARHLGACPSLGHCDILGPWPRVILGTSLLWACHLSAVSSWAALVCHLSAWPSIGHCDIIWALWHHGPVAWALESLGAVLVSLALGHCTNFPLWCLPYTNTHTHQPCATQAALRHASLSLLPDAPPWCSLMLPLDAFWCSPLMLFDAPPYCS